MRNTPWTRMSRVALGLLLGLAASFPAAARANDPLTVPPWPSLASVSSVGVSYPMEPTLAPMPGSYGEAPVAEEAAPPAPAPDPVPAAETYDPAYDGSAYTEFSNPCSRCVPRGACGPCGGCGGAGQPFRLFDFPCLTCRRINVGGWVEQGITFNADNPADRFNGPVATNDRDGEWLMNQAWLFAERSVDTGGYGVDVGGRIDMLYGSDFRFGVNHGLENRINSLDNRYGMVIPQAYLEVGVNNLSVKLGHFAGILDYEMVPGPPNPFYSHSYSYGYTVPQLVTGALATYKLSPQWSVAAGFHRGWMMFEDINDDLDFMGGVFWTSRNKRTSMDFAISTGAQDPAGENNRFVYSYVLKHALTEKLRYVLVHNLGYENNGAGGVQDAEWYGINQYFLYTINPRWSANVRVEWLRDDDGARVFGVPNVLPPIHTWPGGPGFAGNFYELTLGLTWRPHPNVMVRPECRWDWYQGLPGLVGAAPDRGIGLPFNDGNSDNQFTFATDLIVTF